MGGKEKIKGHVIHDLAYNNTIKINKLFNIILWISSLVGPIVAVRMKFGGFNQVRGSHCIYIALATIVFAAAHLLVYRHWKDSLITGMVALVEMDILVVLMCIGKFEVQMGYFVVPMASMMFCNVKMYLATCALNYVLLGACMWAMSSYYVSVSNVFTEKTEWYFDRMGAYSVEYIIMILVGYSLCKSISSHLLQLAENQKRIAQGEDLISEQLGILESMAEVYDNINFVDFENGEVSRLGENEKKESFENVDGARSKLNQEIMKFVVGDMQQKFLDFTNLGTLDKRIGDRKSMSEEFVHTIKGWFRAQYIVISRDSEGKLQRVIYTTRNIEETKRREELLIRISNTDELTGLYNRRSYETDTAAFHTGNMSEDYVIVSADLNGLKITNDTLGHAAGDELIVGAADCLMEALGNMGKVYRVGGDEFMACIHTKENMRDIIDRLELIMANWKGEIVKNPLSMAVGYAKASEHPDYTVDDLEKLADYNMYEQKAIQHSARK